jgi:diguanylate cyclase (GGDEF)-like protein
LRHSWWVFVGAIIALGGVLAFRAFADTTRPGDVLVAFLVAVVAGAGLLHRNTVHQLEVGRRAEAESFARIMQGLSRSISPDAILDAIVEELGVGTGADHVVIVRRPAEANVLEATLVSSRAGVRSTVTRFPITDLDDPLTDEAGTRDPVAIPIAVPSGLELAAAASAGVVVARSSAGSPATARPVSRHPGHATRPTPLPSGSRATSASSARELALAGLVALRRQLGARPPDPALRRRFGRLALVDDRQASPVTGGGAAGRIAERLAARARLTYGLRNTIAAPLLTEAGVMGAIVVSRRSPEPWPDSARRILNGAAIEASAALARATHHRDAEARATTDALTGLPNRRYFDEFCALLARRRRADDAVGVLIVDIDHFKSVNDTWGHGVGDEVLKAVARAINTAVRDDDVPARFGGEEFAVLLRNPSPSVAVDVAERVRAAVGRLDLGELGPERVTVSVGVAVAESAAQPIGQVIEAADRALYEAKRTGRDRVVAARGARALPSAG